MASPKGTTETTGHHPPGGSAFPPFDPSTFAPQLIWLTLTFGALYLLLSRLALPAIGSVLNERKDRIERDLAEAERMKAETDAALKSYESSLANARGRAQSLARETRDKLNADIEQNRQQADQQNAAKVADMEKRIAENKARALASVNDIAADTASAIVQKLLGRDVPLADIQKAVAKRSGR